MQIAWHESLKFGQLTLWKIIKIKTVATRCQILRLKCNKFNFGWGSAPDPTGGAYSTPPDPLAKLRGPSSKGRGREGERKGGDGNGRRGDGTPPLHAPPNPYFWICPWDPSLGLRIRPADRQASALACKGSVCHPKRERKKRKKPTNNTVRPSNVTVASQGFYGVTWPRQL